MPSAPTDREPPRHCRVSARCATLVALAACAAALGAARAPAAPAQAAVAAPDAFGAAAAAEILGRGGNAVDAAVALAFTLAVTYPEAGNLGGGGFATLVIRGKPYFLDYRERAPLAASVRMYLDAHGNVIPDASTVGAGAAAVPGTVAGLWELHRRFAKLAWRTDLAAAIRYARQGFEVPAMLIAERDQRARELAGRTNFERYFGALAAGETFRQPQLAATLERIARGRARRVLSRSHGCAAARADERRRTHRRAPTCAATARAGARRSARRGPATR